MDWIELNDGFTTSFSTRLVMHLSLEVKSVVKSYSVWGLVLCFYTFVQSSHLVIILCILAHFTLCGSIKELICVITIERLSTLQSGSNFLINRGGGYGDCACAALLLRFITEFERVFFLTWLPFLLTHFWLSPWKWKRGKYLRDFYSIFHYYYMRTRWMRKAFLSFLPEIENPEKFTA